MQRAVLSATLEALCEADCPGSVTHLPFAWPEPASDVHWHPKEPSPIIQLLGRDPTLFQRVLDGDIPPEASIREP